MIPVTLRKERYANGIEIRVRHELGERQMRMLETLGASVVIDPAAPECFHVHSRTYEVERCRRCARVERA